MSPIGLGAKHIGPITAEFQNLYPKTTIELNLSDIPKWSVHDNLDMMFYIGQLQDSTLKRIVLAKNRRLLLTSPEHLQSAPSLTHQKDLDNHRCIALRENDEDATRWRFTEMATGGITSVRIYPVLPSNVVQIIKDWCVEGEGIILRSEWDVQPEFKILKLLEFLSSYQLVTADVIALLSSERLNRSKKVTTFLDFLKTRLAERLTSLA